MPQKRLFNISVEMYGIFIRTQMRAATNFSLSFGHLSIVIKDWGLSKILQL